MTSGYDYVCVAIYHNDTCKYRYFQYPKYIGHISANDKTKMHASITSIHFPHTLFIHNASQLVYLQNNHAIEINKFEEKK